MAHPFPTAAVAITTQRPRGLDNTLNDPAPVSMNIAMNELREGLIIRSPGANLILTAALADAIPAFAALKTGMQTSIIPKLQANIAEFNPAIVAKRNRGVIESYVRPLWQGAQEAAVKFDEGVEREIARFEAIPAATDPVLEQAFRDEIRAGTKAQKIQLLNELPIEAVIAVKRVGPAAFGLTDADFEPALERLRAYNVSNADAPRLGLTKRPTLADPIARGTDEDAVSAYAAEAIKIWRNRRELVSDARTELRQIVLFVAIVCEMKVEDAFKMLSGTEADDAK